jgi:MYXO-CTERM domain-containing protein
MKSSILAIATTLLPVVAAAAPTIDVASVRPVGSGVEFHAAGHLGRMAPADLAHADRLVSALPAGVTLPAAAREPGAFRLGKHFALRPGGQIQRLSQQIGGIPVEGASLAVRLDANGELRWTAGRVVDPARATATHPVLSAREAVARANALSPVASANVDVAHLVYLPLGEEVVLAYRVDLPAQPGPRLDAPTVWLDAANGELLARVNRIRALNQARVYPENPVSTPTLETVTLPDLPENATSLTGTWVAAKNCIDEHQTVEVSSYGETYYIHVCTEKATAFPDENGDFFFEPVLDQLDPARFDDKFAEVHGYYHVNRAYAFFRELGLDRVDTTPLPTVVNYRYPFGSWEEAQNPNAQLYPYDNAFFLPGGTGLFGEDRPYDSIVFGQGNDADYGYDGGVFYHEFTHAVVSATCDLGWAFLDSYGIDGAPGALNEGFADYFAHAMTGDPVIGEYASGDWGAIRSAENDATCPGDLVGETHHDSNFWTGALWDIRELVGSELDQAVFNALVGLPSDASFQVAAEATIAEIATLFDEATAAQARDIFEGRGLLGCNNRVIEFTQSGQERPFMYLSGPYMGFDPMPSYLQFKIEPEHELEELYASVEWIWSDRSYPADVRVVAKVGEPIKFRKTFGTRVTGDWDHEVEFESVSRRDVATFETPIPAGPIYFALINRGIGEAMIGEFEIHWTEAIPVDPGTGGTGGSGEGGTGGDPGEGGAGGADEKPTRGGGSDSSGCNQAGAGPAALGLLAAAALLLRRRRA